MACNLSQLKFIRKNLWVCVLRSPAIAALFQQDGFPVVVICLSFEGVREFITQNLNFILKCCFRLNRLKEQLQERINTHIAFKVFDLPQNQHDVEFWLLQLSNLTPESLKRSLGSSITLRWVTHQSAFFIANLARIEPSPQSLKKFTFAFAVDPISLINC